MQIVFYSLYALVWTFILPVLWLLAKYFIPKWKDGLAQRLGNLDGLQLPPKPLWFHAVSVGELNALLPLLGFFKGYKVILSVTTSTAYKLANEKLADEIELNQIQVFYMPWDHPVIIAKTLEKIDPQAVIIMESEIWPALFYQTKRRGAKLVLINAKLSDKSFKNYMRISPVFRDIFAQVDLFFAQSSADSRKFLQLGVSPKKIYMMGNMKFSALPRFDEKKSAELKQFIGYQPDDFLVVCGSTHEEEEALLISIFQELKFDLMKEFDHNRFSKLRLVIAPRHPERFHTVETMINSAAKLIPVRYSEIKGDRRQTAMAEHDVLLVDTIGDLFDIYSIADIAVIGGTINENIGGHNVLEPAVCRVPVVIGPHYHKNIAMVDMMEEADAIYVAAAKEDIRLGMMDLIKSQERRVLMSSNGVQLTKEHRKIVPTISEKLKEFVFEEDGYKAEEKILSVQESKL